MDKHSRRYGVRLGRFAPAFMGRAIPRCRAIEFIDESLAIDRAKRLCWPPSSPGKASARHHRWMTARSERHGLTLCGQASASSFETSVADLPITEPFWPLAHVADSGHLSRVPALSSAPLGILQRGFQCEAFHGCHERRRARNEVNRRKHATR